MRVFGVMPDGVRQVADRRSAIAVCAGVGAGILVAGYWFLADEGSRVAAAAEAAPKAERTLLGVPGQPLGVLQHVSAESSAEDPGPQVLVLSDLDPEAARLWNASNPVSPLENAPAKPFRLTAKSEDAARALDCLTAAVYYEAAGEDARGQRAVAQVVLNRVRHPAFPKSVCGVVLQGAQRKTGCQFSFTCDGSLARRPNLEAWKRARRVAEEALRGAVEKSVGNATHYHADYVAPYWSPTLIKVGVIGAHIFYRWTGEAGLPPAFLENYAGFEPTGLQQISDAAQAAGTPQQLVEPGDVVELHLIDEAALAAVEDAKKLDPATPAEPERIVAATELASNAATIVPLEDLDWQGNRRQRGGPRLAAPSKSLF